MNDSMSGPGARLRKAVNWVKNISTMLAAVKGNRVKLIAWCFVGGLILFLLGARWFPSFPPGSIAATATYTESVDRSKERSETKTARSATSMLSDDGRLTLFANALRQSGLDKGLDVDGVWTLFAPFDTALRNEGSDFLLSTVLISPLNARRLEDVVGHHIVLSKRLDFDAMSENATLTDLAGGPVTIERVGNGSRIDGYAVIVDRIEASNGVIYVIDRMLWSESWVEDTLTDQNLDKEFSTSD